MDSDSPVRLFGILPQAQWASCLVLSVLQGKLSRGYKVCCWGDLSWETASNPDQPAPFSSVPCLFCICEWFGMTLTISEVGFMTQPEISSVFVVHQKETFLKSKGWKVWEKRPGSASAGFKNRAWWSQDEWFTMTPPVKLLIGAKKTPLFFCSLVSFLNLAIFRVWPNSTIIIIIIFCRLAL